ncbi:MAG: hypothetical protein R2941_04330 [Desulfobacterales bacterium]
MWHGAGKKQCQYRTDAGGTGRGWGRNIIFLRTDTPIPENVVEELRNLPLVNTVIPLEL